MVYYYLCQGSYVVGLSVSRLIQKNVNKFRQIFLSWC